MANTIEGTPISRAGTTVEQDNNRTNIAGLYRHPESGEELVTLFDPLYGNAQSDAAVRVGFVRVGDTPAPKTEADRIEMPSAPTPEVKPVEVETPKVEAAVVSPDIQEKIKADAQDRAAKQVKNN